MPENSDEMIVEGYAIRFEEPATFNVWGETITEVIDRSALLNADMTDVLFKYNHSDTGMIMARTRSKTLTLTPDGNGLHIRAALANTTAGRDLYALIQRGDIDKMSFTFTAKRDAWDRKTLTRRILEIDRLYDVSAVDLPAYDTTSIYARGAEEGLKAIRAEMEARMRIKIRTL